MDWRGKRVLITGHTGFKGSWLVLWLHYLGAKVHGLSLPPAPGPQLFHALDLPSLLEGDYRGDITNPTAVHNAFQLAQPEVVFHLAAQPLVRASYSNPEETFHTNVIGTARILGACRHSSVRAVVCITTDKCYENREWIHPYRETDRLGGYDPYSASKACAEFVASCYRSSFTDSGGMPPIHTARAGNVIGGGDWSPDRLVPDCLRAFAEARPVRLRYPKAIRPWQHVLDPLWGYILCAEHLLSGADRKGSAWNFGPDNTGEASVEYVAGCLAALWGGTASVDLTPEETAPHEAQLLRLDSTKARLELRWQPKWTLDRALSETISWHLAHREGRNMRDFSIRQIQDYQNTIPSP
jgi:CDP-glucose 4,6-dehydratase